MDTQFGENLRREFGIERVATDADAAQRIYHRMKSLPRSIEVQVGFGYQLVLLDAQRYLRWRWIAENGMVPTVRLLGRGTSPWRNGVARLWWVSEVCGGDSAKVKLICGVQQAIDSGGRPTDLGECIVGRGALPTTEGEPLEYQRGQVGMPHWQPTRANQTARGSRS